MLAEGEGGVAVSMPVALRTEGLRVAGRSLPVRPADIRRRAERMMVARGVADAELSVLLCSDAVIHDLNRRYREKDQPTDVLAFALEEGEPMPGLPMRVLGDVVISLPTARRQALRAGHSVVHEVTILLAHGLLHLLGYDHRDEEELRVMQAATDVLVMSIIHSR